MLFKEALIKIYEENDHLNLLHPFKVYSYLSDLTYDNFKEREKVKIYFKLLEHLNLFDYLINGSLDEIKALKKKDVNYDFLSKELYKEFLNLTISLKYQDKDFKPPKPKVKNLDNKVLIYGYYNGKNKILHHSLKCKALGKENVYLKMEGKKQTCIPCRYCYLKKLKKDHKYLLNLAEMNAALYKKKLPLIPLRLKGKKVSVLDQQAYALGRKKVNEI